MDAPKAKYGSVRQKFFSALAGLPEDITYVHMASLARGLGVTPSALPRYLREARAARWIGFRRTVVGIEVTILDRDGLKEAAGLEASVRRGG